MSLITTRLESGRWGIFRGDRLLLTVGSQQTLETIIGHLSRRQIQVQVTSAH